ncbi:MAG: heme ABC exporter ATP-binding protein CcmA [Candidatus Puniceispirillum sp. TMED52]|nr:heme ABC exporter ATP-binding protein CcmA [SAR116 cluster bacterium]OUU52463.1 MAG: heme ABC exporter ATP-binding protein CcmA [Candidatus Puniceispirillum sp. TMED52]
MMLVTSILTHLPHDFWQMTSPSIHPSIGPSIDLRLAINDLAISREGGLLIQGLNLELKAGQVLFLRGANGSGKTTLLRALAKLIPLHHGQYAINGVPHTADHAALMRQLLLVGHRNAGVEHLNVISSLRLMASLMNIEASPEKIPEKIPEQIRKKIMTSLDALGIKPLAERQISHLSAGQQRRLALARLMLAADMTHRLWLIDEPFNALDDDAARRLCDIITSYCSQGGSAVISGHGTMPLTPDMTLTLGTSPSGELS